MEWKSKKAILFDLGGVLLNLDYQRTEDAFVQLGLTDFNAMYSQLAQTDLFNRFEIGDISAFHFVNRLLDQLPAGTTANQVVHAWNAMILDFPKERMEWLRSLGAQKPIYLFSNTNELHIDVVRRRLHESTGSAALETYFNGVYFSSEVGRRKPNPETFQWFLDQHQFTPEEVLFIDDSLQHIEGASSIGIEARLLKPGEEVSSLFLD